MGFVAYYPTQAGVTSTWTPTYQPLPGSIPGRISGFMEQRTASGRKIHYRIHPEFRTWRLSFEWMPEADLEARMTFFDAVAGRAFEIDTDFESGLYTVKFTGVSLNFQPVSLGAGFYRWEEDLEEQADMPASVDASILRSGYVDISGTSMTGTATLSEAFADANYVVVITSATSTNTGDSVGAHVVEGSLTAADFDIQLDAAPGSGNTVRVYYIAIRQ